MSHTTFEAGPQKKTVQRDQSTSTKLAPFLGTDRILLEQPCRSAPSHNTANLVPSNNVGAFEMKRSHENLKNDIQFIVQHYAPTATKNSKEASLSRNQICGAWVDVLPLIARIRKNDQPLVSAIETLATALRHHDLEGDIFQPQILEMYCKSLGHMSRALTESQGAFQVEHCAAIMCLAVTDVCPEKTHVTVTIILTQGRGDRDPKNEVWLDDPCKRYRRHVRRFRANSF